MLTRFVANRRTGALKLAVLLCALSLAACSEDPDLPGFVTDASSVGPGPTPTAEGGTGMPAVDAGGVIPSNPAAEAGVVTPTMEAGGPVAQQDASVTLDASPNPGQPDAQAEAGTSNDAGGDASGPRADLGKGDGKDVITIGDSWMNYLINGGGIQRALLEASGQRYRTYAVAGTKLLDEVIPRQYATAKRENPNIKTVVMTGGGNDILLGFSLESAMSVIDKVAVRLDTLWTEMGKDGVQDVVYIEYSEGGDNGANVRYGIEKVGPVCMNHKGVRCHFMLSDPIINKALVDGIHPTTAACTKLGKAAFDLMVKEGMRR
jgi:hypothetical protein